MSIYKRKSGRWAVLVDSDREPFRLLAEIPNEGRRLTKTIGTFSSRSDAEKRRDHLIKDGNTQSLVIMENARGRRTLGTFKTQKEAERAEREWLSAKDRGIDLSPATVSVKVLVNRYVVDRNAIGFGKKTVEEYHRIDENYIAPNLGNYIVSELKPVHVSAWVAMLLDRGGRDEKPIAKKTARHAFGLLNAALRWGVKMEIVGRNVCEAVTPPKPARSTAKALTLSEVGALSSIARGTRWEPFIAIALMLGARRGEVLALTWNDVELDAGRVTIRASLSQTKGAVALKSTKTDRVRTVPIQAKTVAAFRKQRAQQAADKLLLGEAYPLDVTQPVFTDELGARLSPRLRRTLLLALPRRRGSLRPASTALGIRSPRFSSAPGLTCVRYRPSWDIRTRA